MAGLRVVVVLIAVSVPLFIGVEALLREYVLGPIYGPLLSDIRDLRWPELTNEVLAARATRFAWVMIGVTAVAGLTVVDPLVAVTIGIVVLQEAAGAPWFAVIAYVAAGGLAVYGVFQLAKYHPQAQH